MLCVDVIEIKKNKSRGRIGSCGGRRRKTTKNKYVRRGQHNNE